jgi:hypothetical protein
LHDLSSQEKIYSQDTLGTYLKGTRHLT